MTMEIRMDGKAIREAIGTIESLSSQVPYASMIAVNRTAEEATAALRVHLQKAFTIRQPRMLDLIAPKILPAGQRATKQNPSVLLTPRNYSRVLDAFEKGEMHRTTTGPDGQDQPVIIPTTILRPTKASIISRYWYPVNLGLQARRTINPRTEGPYFYALGRGSLGGRAKKGAKKRATPFHTTSGGRIQIKGRRGTFVLNQLTAPYLDPKKWGVYRREGSEVRKLWNYKDTVPRRPILEFEAIQLPIAEKRLRPNFEGAFELATRTAKP